jgi:hypothetical protein
MEQSGDLYNHSSLLKYTNMPEEETYDEQYDVDCNGRNTGEKVRRYRYGSANRFYINYYMDSKSATDRQKGAPETTKRVSRNKRVFDDVY